jgi:chlorobactene glucosyltransferase
LSDWLRIWEQTRGEDIAFLFSLAGFVAWLTRTGAYRRRILPYVPGLKSDFSKLSIVIPARNEEHQIAKCIQSLVQATRGQAEIIVVDDQSSDGTAAVVEGLKSLNPQLHLIRIGSGEGSGKNQACARGAEACDREWILFTDADTQHQVRGTELLIAQAQGQSWDLTSALPHHLNPSWWEKLTAAFHALVFIPTAPYQDPTTARLFAIGQYLLFKRTAYEAIGGHRDLGPILAEDVELATRILNAKLNYQVWTSTSPVAVRMYTSFADFAKGWRRNIRLGMARTQIKATLELSCVYSLFVNPFVYGGSHGSFDLWLVALAAVAMVWLVVVSREWGNFGVGIHSALSIFVGLPLFAVISLGAAFDHLASKSVVWKDRTHKVGEL